MADAMTYASEAAALRADLAELEAARDRVLECVPVSVEAGVRAALTVERYQRVVVRTRLRIIEAETA